MVTEQDVTEVDTGLVSPYKITKSVLGTTTKLLSKQFICSIDALDAVMEQMVDKLKYINPTSVGFRYLASYTDRTHFENENLDIFRSNIKNSSKKTEKLILNWEVSHEIDGKVHDLSIIIRLSNPINPLMYLQAAFSKSPGDADNLELDGGLVSISVNGASQTFTEEIFELVARWVDSCPKPYNTNVFVNWMKKVKSLLLELNYWFLLISYIIVSFIYIKGLSIESSLPVIFLLLCGFTLFTKFVNVLNSNISEWFDKSDLFSIFDLTNGDSNQQTKFIGMSKVSVKKIVASLALSLCVNLAAGYIVYLTI